MMYVVALESVVLPRSRLGPAGAASLAVCSMERAEAKVDRMAERRMMREVQRWRKTNARSWRSSTTAAAKHAVGAVVALSDCCLQNTRSIPIPTHSKIPCHVEEP